MKKSILIIILTLVFNSLTAQDDIVIHDSSIIDFAPETKKETILTWMMMRSANLIPDSMIHEVDSFLILSLGKDSFNKLASNITTWEYNMNGEVIGGSLFNKGKPKKPRKISLFDSLTNNKYVLDKKYIMITAYNNKKKIIWKTDPYLDNRILPYRTNRPRIISFKFGKTPDYYVNKVKSGKTVLWITYNNTQYGFIDLVTGEYYFCGQD